LTFLSASTLPYLIPSYMFFTKSVTLAIVAPKVFVAVSTNAVAAGAARALRPLAAFGAGRALPTDEVAVGTGVDAGVGAVAAVETGVLGGGLMAGLGLGTTDEGETVVWTPGTTVP